MHGIELCHLHIHTVLTTTGLDHRSPKSAESTPAQTGLLTESKRSTLCAPKSTAAAPVAVPRFYS